FPELVEPNPPDGIVGGHVPKNTDLLDWFGRLGKQLMWPSHRRTHEPNELSPLHSITSRCLTRHHIRPCGAVRRLLHRSSREKRGTGLGQARSPRPDPKGLLVRQMTSHIPDPAAPTARVFAVCQERTLRLAALRLQQYGRDR